MCFPLTNLPALPIVLNMFKPQFACSPCVCVSVCLVIVNQTAEILH